MSVDYQVLKIVHVSAVGLSIGGFFLRGMGALTGAAWMTGWAARRLPHLIDTVLLLSAISLASLLGLAPWAVPWLAAKIVGLVVYIALGMLALRPGRSRPVRAAAWFAALATAAWIVSVAISKDPRGFFVLL